MFATRAKLLFCWSKPNTFCHSRFRRRRCLANLLNYLFPTRQFLLLCTSCIKMEWTTVKTFMGIHTSHKRPPPLSYHLSKHRVRESKTSTVRDSGFRAVDFGFFFSETWMDCRFQSLVAFRILWAALRISKARSPDSQNFPDSGFHKHKFPGFQNPDSLTWRDPWSPRKSIYRLFPLEDEDDYPTV